MDTPLYDHLTAADFEHVYEPAEDSFLLLDALESDLPFLEQKLPLVCLEIGSGSGIVITALSKKLKTFCMATDINSHACMATKRTMMHNSVFLAEAINCNLADVLRPKIVDVLIFNPPYVVTPDEEIISKDHQQNCTENNLVYSWAGGSQGRRIIDKLLTKLDYILSETGVFYLLLLQENKPAEIKDLLEQMNFLCCVLMERHIPGERLCVLKITRKIE